jgi:hypothetical protein
MDIVCSFIALCGSEGCRPLVSVDLFLQLMQMLERGDSHELVVRLVHVIHLVLFVEINLNVARM